jgi:DNA-binding CsgD family transcriptional regulator
VTVLAALAFQLLALAVIILLYRRTLLRLESRVRALDTEIQAKESEIREGEQDREELRTVLIDRDPFVAALHEKPRYLQDADWERLEGILDTVCDHFPSRLRERWPEMTQAELRTAVLLRYHFSGQQMAAMMGISPASVTKAKQRLKARLGQKEYSSFFQALK